VSENHNVDVSAHFAIPALTTPLILSWLRVSGTTKMPQIDHGVRHQLHTVMALLFELKAQQESFELWTSVQMFQFH
jgi:hypothetical protein